MSTSSYSPLAFDIQIILMSNCKALPSLVIYQLLPPKDIPDVKDLKKTFILEKQNLNCRY